MSNASSYAQVNWIQTITLTQDGKSNTYVDGGGLYNTAKAMSDPDYQRVLKSQGADTIFADEPRRLAQDTTVTWHSDLQLVGVNASGSPTTLKTMSYGFSLAPSGAVTPEPLKGVP